MLITNQVKNQHLLWRAAFGPMAENAAGLDQISQKKLWELLLATSAKSPDKIIVAKNMIDGLYMGAREIVNQQKMEAADQKEQMARQRRNMRQQSRDEIKNLNLLWLNEMINGQAQLREKMSLFWHGHFACRVVNSYFQQELLHIIRTDALGNFGDLLRQVSKSPSMLQFLNNQQNKKKKPNENFAREVMELFTMGRGNYTETDIKEAARAFTGWGFDLQGQFVFRKSQHDDGIKTFMGKTGNFNGDDILDMLLENRQTAKYITKKIYRYLVNEDLDNEKTDWLSDRFFASKYNIKSLLTDIFTSHWFYEGKNIGTKIKAPVELLVGIRRFLPLELDNDNVQLLFQKVLGQVLFYPPNVAGWAGGRNWIDSSTLMIRLQVPQVFAAKESLNIRPKNDDDLNMGQVMEEELRMKKKLLFASKGGSAEIHWEPVYKVFEKTDRNALAQKIQDTLLQTGSRVPANILDTYLQKDSRENFIRSAVVNVMSTLEYQLC